jgi:ABC-2 type transport system permease protein
LSQILSSGVSPAEIVIGKLSGVIIGVMVMIIPAAIIAGAALWQAFGRFSLLMLIQFAYLLTVAAFIVAVSAAASTTRRALIALLCGWAAGFVILPVVITDIAQVIHPSPTSLQYAAAQMDAARKMPTVEERRAVVRARLLNEYGKTSLRDLPVDPIGIELTEEEQESEPLYSGLVGLVYDSYEQQNQIFRAGAVLTPLLAVRPLSMAISVSDFTTYRDFAAACERYRRQMVQLLNDAITYNPNYRNGTVFPGTDIIVAEAGGELWQRVPEFRYEAPDALTILGRSRVSILLLAVWLALAGTALQFATRRLTVT